MREACAHNQPYALVFMDVRMPPGWDGVETTGRLWQADPELQVVICTAYSDYSLEETLTKLGNSDRLLILKKPYDNAEVLQLANALTEKWSLARQARLRLADLERMVQERTSDLEQAHRLIGFDPSLRPGTSDRRLPIGGRSPDLLDLRRGCGLKTRDTAG